MSFTYTPGGTTDTDRIRLEIGDTVDGTVSNESLHDEEIAELVARHGSWEVAVSAAARVLAMKLSVQPTSKTIGELQIVQKRVDYLLAKAAQWEASAGGAGHRLATPSAGGTSMAATRAQEANTDRPRSAFRKPEP